jgi:hypothetical protein
MERTRENVGPSRGDNADGREQRLVSMPQPQPLAVVDQFRNKAHERHDLAESSHEGE